MRHGRGDFVWSPGRHGCRPGVRRRGLLAQPSKDLSRVRQKLRRLFILLSAFHAAFSALYHPCAPRGVLGVVPMLSGLISGGLLSDVVTDLLLFYDYCLA